MMQAGNSVEFDPIRHSTSASLDRLSRLGDHVALARTGAPPWTSEVGCGGLASNRYEAAFRENEISETVLPSLTAEDLKELGVGLVGHRRMLLDAIAALRANSERTTPSADAATRSSRRGHSRRPAERRQVTVMFSDLVGSTALSARMDPEDLREVISAYQKCVAETVRRFGGFVAKYMGDGVLIYFGYPQAHEDDAERAVRAGLELIAAVSCAQIAGLHCKPALASPPDWSSSAT